MNPEAWRRRWPAPAKLNLFLHVVGRRADGYHLLQTVFRLIDLVDWIELSPRADGAIRLAEPLPGVPEDTDLTVRAARLLQRVGAVRTGVTIRVAKRIPIGGGLGGGSSDAATTLIALDELWGTGLSRAELSALAVRLGADVPFFLLGRNAFAEGIGERLTPLDLGPAWYVVITPQVAVSTREIFSSTALTRDTKPLTITAFFAGLGRNDLEPVVCGRFPQVARALEWLKGFGDARMSGSGASVFAAFRTESEARAVVARIPGEWRGIAVCGLDRHPLASE
ncbi:MAG TPA: 4-(cytidine 5'-diphospho)-2-C-methyl-D-erythritol kinase [Burkholderiales bacterium]|nr:4-(cytidine 5'-diphospho)-2-C-methyl-D-erythritol kinase [Burkholderiales bacterium]